MKTKFITSFVKWATATNNLFAIRHDKIDSKWKWAIIEFHIDDDKKKPKSKQPRMKREQKLITTW